GTREARRTALVLSAAQAVLGSGAPICFALGALAGDFLLGADKSLATAPLTGFNIGVAAGALPAAALIRALGQRYGFLAGTLVIALGGLVATMALFNSSFWLFAFGLLLVGTGNACVQQFRFAAADSAPHGSMMPLISSCSPGAIIHAVGFWAGHFSIALGGMGPQRGLSNPAFGLLPLGFFWFGPETPFCNRFRSPGAARPPHASRRAPFHTCSPGASSLQFLAP